MLFLRSTNMSEALGQITMFRINTLKKKKKEQRIDDKINWLKHIMSVAMITRKGRNMDYITGVKNIKEKINSVREVPKELI